jgi:queuosine precursor transporter
MVIPAFLWVIFTLGGVSCITLLAKKFGVGFLYGAIATLVITAAILANKLIQVGPFVVPGGVLLASATFLITDALSEWWSKEDAQKAVWIGFIGLIILVVSLQFLAAWPSPTFASKQGAEFVKILGLTPRIALASIAAYLISQHHDVWSYHIWKNLTKGRFLWLRNNASTITSQILDSIIFISIAFGGVLPILPLIQDMLIIKISIALLDTPFMYIISWCFKDQRSRVNPKHKLASI